MRKWKYKDVYVPEHPNARKNGCVLEHRLVSETILGRLLTAEEVVHHCDNNPANNVPSNLWVFATSADHARYHETGRWVLIEGIYHSPKVEELDQSLCSRNGCNNYIKSTGTKFCSVKCTALSNRVFERPTAELLKEQQEQHTFRCLGRQYGVSDNAIRKWCKSYGLTISKHQRGYVCCKV